MYTMTKRANLEIIFLNLTTHVPQLLTTQQKACCKFRKRQRGVFLQDTIELNKTWTSLLLLQSVTHKVTEVR